MSGPNFPRHIATVTANEPPEGLTLADWLAWRSAEDARMLTELLTHIGAWLEAIAEREAGEVTMH